MFTLEDVTITDVIKNPDRKWDWGCEGLRILRFLKKAIRDSKLGEVDFPASARPVGST